MKEIITVASGKGGVGKTVITANLGLALAGLKQKTILVDLDLGSSNLHTNLGIKNNNPGVGSFIYKKAGPLKTLVQKTPYDNLSFIPGDTLLPGTANLPFFAKKKLLKELKELECDTLILDLGAGSSFNTVDFFLTGTRRLLVTTPETTSVLSTYGFLKTTAYRLLYLSFPPRSDERALIHGFLSNRLEGSGKDLAFLIRQLQIRDPERMKAIRSRFNAMIPGVIMNCGRTEEDLLMARRLRRITRKNLKWELDFISYIKRDDLFFEAQKERTPILIKDPESVPSEAIKSLGKLITDPRDDIDKKTVREEDQDIFNLIQKEKIPVGSP